MNSDRSPSLAENNFRQYFRVLRINIQLDIHKFSLLKFFRAFNFVVDLTLEINYFNNKISRFTVHCDNIINNDIAGACGNVVVSVD